jgi:hypothetical protein
MADLLQHVRESGFAFPDRLIHLFVGGSELHGAKVHGTDDLDILWHLHRTAGAGSWIGIHAAFRVVDRRERRPQRPA